MDSDGAAYRTRCLERWNHSHRKWETFFDAIPLSELPTYRINSSLCLGGSGRVRVGSECSLAAFHPVSRQPAQTNLHPKTSTVLSVCKGLE